jgi:hypothetical protein
VLEDYLKVVTQVTMLTIWLAVCAFTMLAALVDDD